MPNYIRAQQSGGTFFFTLTAYRRKRILLDTPIINALRESLRDTRKANPFEIAAWVLLPDHMHFIWRLPAGDSDYSRKLGRVKAGVSRRVKGQYGRQRAAQESRIRRRESTIWQRRFWEHQIRNDEDLKAHLDYLHYNPVKHGLVSRVRDWPYSSFHRYVRQGFYGEDWGCEVAFGAVYAGE
jgi:putative transposase